MVKEVANNLDDIIKACKQMQIRSLYLVGSAARETDFTVNSDIDFMYSILPKDSDGQGRYDYFEFLGELEAITGKKVDLIAEERIRNQRFLKSLNEDRIKIYEA